MTDKPWYPVVYMFVVTAFFSSAVIGLARFTHDRVTANEQLAFEKAVLEAAGILDEKAAGRLHETFLERVRLLEDRIDIYVVTDGQGNTAGYVLPVDGKGFWAPIKGVLGLDVDKRKITGIAFYEQNETPGLGGKIVEKQFTDQFVGKELASGDRAIGIEPVTASLNNSQVHAITGATQTCSRLEKLINDSVRKWRGGE
jgi:Na+-transporting NADH:ubiquinone oxidoreductase subunit C